MSGEVETFDVIVVGSGNAGLSAASSASAHGSSVLVLEKAPKEWAGGNSLFTAGAYRTCFSGLDDVVPLLADPLDPELKRRIDMQPYTSSDFEADLKRMTEGRAEKNLVDVLVGESREVTGWLSNEVGVPFVLSFHRQAYDVGGRFKFWGGMVLAVRDGGKGLMKAHFENCTRRGVEIRYDNAVIDLIVDFKGAVLGVKVRRTTDGHIYDVRAKGGVILAAGGFEANPQMRAQHLGPGWDLAYVRGTPYNSGDLLALAMQVAGATPAGNWSGCHSTCWDASAPRNEGDLGLTNQFTKSGYPLGVMVNAEGRRFVDEGEDMRNYTYAKFGRAILSQPASVAFQVWDSKSSAWLRNEEYAPDVVERIEAPTLTELAEKLKKRGLRNTQMFLKTMDEYNAGAIGFRQEQPAVKFDPSIKDGLSTYSKKGGLTLGPDKTNWANPIIIGPFLAVKVTCGITFTFGGLKIDPKTSAAIGNATRKPVPGLYVAGEMVGGLFYGNYPGGSGLTAGAVFGRKAGREAAMRANGHTQSKL
jgi:precorrin 3B synthase CobZ